MSDPGPKLKSSATVFLGDFDSKRPGDENKFDLTQKKIASIWVEKLLVGGHELPEINLPSDFLSAVQLDEPNQRVIKYDCERTRATMPEFRTTETRNTMEILLTFYCKSHKLKYKQGMNEVLAPFVYLKLSNSLETWQQVYSLFSAFIDVFLPRMFSDEDFVFLQKSCALFKTCLRYHAPSLSSRLDAGFVTPEMYVTPWFLTLFASKTALETVFHLWHLLITKGDPHSFIFVSCSLCLSHARVLRAAPKSSLPETITKICMSEDSVVSVWKRSLKIRQHTPPMFTQQLINAGEKSAVDFIESDHLQKQLGDIYPVFVRPMDLFRRPDGWKYIVLDCRSEWVTSSSHIGSLPLAIPFELDSLVANQNLFPVAETLNKVAQLLGVDISQEVPQWPLDNHICLMGLSDSVVDAVGLMYVALSKFSNVPRLSILKGGFQAIHNEVPQELIDHDPSSCPLCNGISIQQVSQRPYRPRAGSSDSSASSPTGNVFQKLKSFVSESSSSIVSSTSRFLVGGATSPIPTSRHMFVPNLSDLVLKSRLVEILGRSPSSDIEANSLLVVSSESFRCFVAPLDMTLLTAKCELRMYGTWKMTDLCKITSRSSQPASLCLYFSVETAPDLVLSFINPETAKNAVEDIRKRYRLANR